MNGTTRSAVIALLRRRNISFNRYGNTGPFKKHDRIKGKLTADEVKRLYAAGKSIAFLCKLDGTTPRAVIRCLQKQGIVMRGREPRFKHAACSLARKAGLSKETFLRFLCIIVLGGKCSQCGNSDLRLLQINHLRAKTRHQGYRDYLDIIRNRIRDRDVRCANCNLLFEFQKGKRKVPVNLKDLLNSCVNSPEFQQFLRDANS